MTDEYQITFDGGSLGNPGKGYGSYRIEVAGRPRPVVRLDYSANGEIVTNNQAEYRTLIAALEEIRNEVNGAADKTPLRVIGDSKLVLEQVAGRWKVKHPDLRPLHATATELIRSFGEVALEWRGRNWAVSVLGH